MPKPRTRWLLILGGLALIVLAVWVVLVGGPSGSADESPGPATSGATAPGVATPGSTGTRESLLETVPESGLPPQARATLELIRSGGPCPHDRDGIIFQNREGILPQRDRGYYTDDHYASFRQIKEGQ